MCAVMLDLFYQTAAVSALFLLWFAGGAKLKPNKLNKPMNKAESDIGCRLDPFEVVVEKRKLTKLFPIKDNPGHPLHQTLDKHWSSFLTDC